MHNVFHSFLRRKARAFFRFGFFLSDTQVGLSWCICVPISRNARNAGPKAEAFLPIQAQFWSAYPSTRCVRRVAGLRGRNRYIFMFLFCSFDFYDVGGGRGCKRWLVIVKTAFFSFFQMKRQWRKNCSAKSVTVVLRPDASCRAIRPSIRPVRSCCVTVIDRLIDWLDRCSVDQMFD